MHRKQSLLRGRPASTGLDIYGEGRHALESTKRPTRGELVHGSSTGIREFLRKMFFNFSMNLHETEVRDVLGETPTVTTVLAANDD